MQEKKIVVCSDQNQVEQTAGLKVLLLRSRVFDLHLFRPPLPLHHALQVLLHAQPPRRTESGSCSHVQTNRPDHRHVLTFSLVSTRSFSCLPIRLCWYTSLISRRSGQLLTGGRCGAEAPDLIFKVRPRPMSEPKGGPIVLSCSGWIGFSAQVLARGASAPQGAPVPLFQGSLASCGSSNWAG